MRPSKGRTGSTVEGVLSDDEGYLLTDIGKQEGNISRNVGTGARISTLGGYGSPDDEQFGENGDPRRNNAFRRGQNDGGLDYSNSDDEQLIDGIPKKARISAKARQN